MKKIYKATNACPKSDYYKPFGLPGVHNLLNILDEKFHSKRKRSVAGLYSVSNLVHYESAVDTTNVILRNKMLQLMEGGDAVNIPKLCQYYAFDVIGQITWNDNFNMIVQQRDPTGALANIETFLKGSAYMGLVSNIAFPVLKSISKILTTNASVLEVIINMQIQDAAANLKKQEKVLDTSNTPYEPFLYKLLKIEATGQVDQDSVRDAVGSNIVAGSDTTGITLSAMLWYIYQNNTILVALRKEIDDLAARGLVSNPVTWKESQEMPYLQAVIMETLRMHPAVSVPLPRVIPKGGVELSGVFFPENTVVGCSAWALHYNPNITAAPEVFRPERWLDGSVRDLSQKPAESFSFGGGSRVCIGKNISMLEIFKVIPQIVREFDLHFDSNDWKLDSAWFVYPRYTGRISLRKT
ncbi:Pisatin demethylase [Colletotrichum tofieldiae]|uniref:Pisatin demethylase n=1 Tax=Colletotrichum tofieldiae TaxID=708197 RepID=A0A166R6H4_9PEZI|nr:Pisatin demethylase [Colletotrichum tofieldiae]